MEEIEFKKWGKIPRLSNETVYLTEKLDGTNGVVYIDPKEGLTKVGSRSRWLSEKEDNFGFYKWCMERTELLNRLSPGYHYGEFVGPGIQRGYGLKEKQWYLFNTQIQIEGLPTVPQLTVSNLSDLSRDLYLCRNNLDIDGSRINPEFNNVEGIVCYFKELGKYLKYIINK